MNRKNSFIKTVFSAGLLTAAVHLLSAVTFDKIVEHKEIILKSNKIKKSLVGYKIAFVSDVHFMSNENLISTVNEIKKRNPDVLLIGGDFAEPYAIMKKQLEILSEIKPKDGIYGVDGNHDRATILEGVMKNLGMVRLDNEGLYIKEGLFLGGVEDLRKGKPDTKAALKNAGKDDFILLLSHNPDICEVQDVKGADLVLSGHTHGGQITVFGAYAPALYAVSNYGQKYKTGMVTGDMGRVYVTNGLGNHQGVPRIFARPQVIYFTLKRG